MVYIAILAGGRRKNYIRGAPKCFLRMPDGRTIVEHLLEEIHRIPSIKGVAVVGPREGLASIDKHLLHARRSTIVLVDQRQTQFENIYAAKEALVKHFRIPKAEDKGIIYLMGDTPFRQAHSIKEFILQIDTAYDFINSLIPEKTFHSYCSLFKKPLIPLHIDGKLNLFKEANMMYLNADRINPDLATAIYANRHSGRITEALRLRKMAKQLVGNQGLAMITTYFLARTWHRALRRFTPRCVHTPSKLFKRLDIDKASDMVGRAMKLRVGMVFSSFPDGYIDLDTRRDYDKIVARYSQIKDHIEDDCANRLIEND
ncbi:MAG: NTP transferase domain-containing protein [Nanoarchaeota archaeon]